MTPTDRAASSATLAARGLRGLACVVLLPLLVVGPTAAIAARAMPAPAASPVTTGTRASTAVLVRAPAQTSPDPSGAGPAGTTLRQRDPSYPPVTAAADRGSPDRWKVVAGLLTLVVLVLAALGLGRRTRGQRPGV